MLLALDTSTAAVTAAVLSADGATLAQASVVDARRHGELVSVLMSQVCADSGLGVAGIETVAVGVGPGPFTGLRVGISSALAFAHARKIPVHGVCSLDALAQRAVLDGAVASDAEGFLVASDARRREVYWAHYRSAAGYPERLAGPEVASAADLPVALRRLPAVGQGVSLYPEAFADSGGPRHVDAVALGTLAIAGLNRQWPGLVPVQPLYLRRPDARVPGPPKAVPLPPARRGTR